MTNPSLNDACCNTPPTSAEWTKRGEDKVLGTKIQGEDRLVYRTGPKDAKRGIISVYDIFGFHPTGVQFFDRLALSEGGFQVSVPHFFKELMPLSLLTDRPAIMAWLGAHGDYTKCHFKEYIDAAIEDLRADGCTSFSIVGQCWGAYIAVQAASEPGNPFLACGGPHPSMMSIEGVKDVTCPLVLLPAQEDADMVPIIESLKHKNFKVESKQVRFDNVHHGWTGGRGDWSDPVQFKAGLEAIDILARYYAEVAAAANL
ncbi:hypothetical protein EMPS_06784 [Entomortierella parvispora]|uniref:Dienelactone hydrolase domain-containing protein n=1 Tax=Entomortierella parvispora TaxID=205924 RepID=A0A9P3LXJ7_9FUNG|nr:hypothetical protein EMPS_06784 [Entomortierella parvispora]